MSHNVLDEKIYCDQQNIHFTGMLTKVYKKGKSV